MSAVSEKANRKKSQFHLKRSCFNALELRWQNLRAAMLSSSHPSAISAEFISRFLSLENRANAFLAH